MKEENRKVSVSLNWDQYSWQIPEDKYFLTLSCILTSFYPASETMIPRLYNLLGIEWSSGGTNSQSGWTCCSAISYHGDIMPIESVLLIAGRQWSITREAGMEVLTPTCVTSYGNYCECKELFEQEPGLKEEIGRMLYKTCGRELYIPEHIIHVSDVYHHYRNRLRKEFMIHELVEEKTGRPLKVVDHVGCHYSKLFPEKVIGGSEYCDVLSGMVRAWGGENVDYPERRHCCGMGFRQCMITPNRWGTMNSVYKKFKSMLPSEPDMIITNCPGCQVFLDKMQWTIYETIGEKIFIPVLTYQEVAGLLMGWDPYDVVGLQFHNVPVEPLLRKMGIPYNENKTNRLMSINA